MDPTTMVQSTALEQFQSLLASMIFLGIDGHHVLLRSIAKSLKDVPPGAIVLRPALFDFVTDATENSSERA